jgi:HtrA serine peptidase 2
MAKLPLFVLLPLLSSSIANCDYPEHEDEERHKNRQNGKLCLSMNFVADVVEVCSPAVVNIVAIGGIGFGGVMASAGSGFIISKDGFVVTNAHVVSSTADGSVVVTLKDGSKKAGRVHSMDTNSDIAIIKIDDLYIDHPLPTIPFGVSSKVRAGEFVVAIGSPMQLQNSASFGIVSATARHASELGISNNRAEYIQTDAAVNIGNSGGPLVNLDGEVIGINTMKVKNVDGISLAIPIDTAAVIINQLVHTKHVVRPYVGLRMANLIPVQEETDRFLSFFRNKRRSSPTPSMLTIDKMQVVVTDVVRGSPAHLAGVQIGDVVLNINGKEVKSVKDVLNEIGLEVGKSLDITVRRREDVLKLTFTTASEVSRSS